jgi:hypothetical protein
LPPARTGQIPWHKSSCNNDPCVETGCRVVMTRGRCLLRASWSWAAAFSPQLLIPASPARSRRFGSWRHLARRSTPSCAFGGWITGIGTIPATRPDLVPRGRSSNRSGGGDVTVFREIPNVLAINLVDNPPLDAACGFPVQSSTEDYSLPLLARVLAESHRRRSVLGRRHESIFRHRGRA